MRVVARRGYSAVDCGRGGGVGVDVMRGYSAVEEEEEWKLL